MRGVIAVQLSEVMSFEVVDEGLEEVVDGDDGFVVQIWELQGLGIIVHG